MNCEQVKPLLSAFYDDELVPDQRASIAEHVSSCPDCARRLESLKSLSVLVQRSPIPPTPKGLFDKLQLATAASSNPSVLVRQPSFAYGPTWVMALLATAAVIVGFVLWQVGWRAHHYHPEVAAAYGQFLDAFADGKSDAIQILVDRYQGKAIDVQRASHVLKHSSVAPPTLLANHEVTGRYELRMPDCDCVATVYACEGKTSLVLLEHDREHSEWLGNRSMTRTTCAGKSCCLVPLNGSMLASWRENSGHVTVVGVRDETQLEQLIGDLAKT